MCELIVFMAPDAGSAETAKRVSRRMGVEMDIYVTQGSEKVEAACKAVENGAEVLISRWGYAYEEMSKLIPIPLVLTKMSAIDIARSLSYASKLSNSIWVATSEQAVNMAVEIASYMGVRLLGTTILRTLAPPEIEHALLEAQRQGADTIIGGVTITSAARAAGLNGIQIQIGEEVLTDAINEALRLIPLKRRERIKTEEMRTIIDSISDGVVAIDKEGQITVFNLAAQNLTGVKAGDALGASAELIIPELDPEKVRQSNTCETGLLKVLKGKKVVVNRVPVLTNGENVGGVITFAELSQIQSIEQKARAALWSRGLVAKATFSCIIGNSRAINEVIKLATQLCQIDEPVLIIGETGTGKELFAQSIHNGSPRKNGPFVAINCAAIPESLLESELFGYREGAFTGARPGGKPGLFEIAHKGTIFLDEVAEMPGSVQSRLLRVLQEHEVTRLGDDKVIPVDVRVIAATNKNLDAKVSSGSFRADLYYRLNVLSFCLPPLRERKEDIPILFRHFAEELASKSGRRLGQLTEDALQCLCDHSWPGNVRELRNVVYRLSVLSEPGKGITSEKVRQAVGACLNIDMPAPASVSLRNIEIDAIQRALKATGGNKTKAAQLLGISYSTLLRRLKKLEKESC
jgi:PAS domain S-box-containing protein